MKDGVAGSVKWEVDPKTVVGSGWLDPQNRWEVGGWIPKTGGRWVVGS